MSYRYTISDFRRDMRHPYAWPGGYPRFFVCDDGEALSFEAARENCRLILESLRDKTNDGWRVIGCAINWDDPMLVCADSGKRIASAYAEPEDKPVEGIDR